MASTYLQAQTTTASTTQFQPQTATMASYYFQAPLIPSTTSASNNGYGILLVSSSNNNNFYNTTSTSNSYYGISLVSSSNNNNFYNTTSTLNSWQGISLVSSSSNNFNNLDSYSNTEQEIYSGNWGSATGNVLIYNNTFGEIKFKALSADVEGTLRFGNGQNIQIGNNSAFLNSSSDISELNVSANVTLLGLRTDYTNPKIYRDGVNVCNSTTSPACFNFTSLNAGTVVFNVSSWSNYSIGEGSSPDTTYPIFYNITNTTSGDFGVNINNTNGTVRLILNGNTYSATNIGGNHYRASHSLLVGTNTYYWESWGNGFNENYNYTSNYTIILNRTPNIPLSYTLTRIFISFILGFISLLLLAIIMVILLTILKNNFSKLNLSQIIILLFSILIITILTKLLLDYILSQL